MSRLGDTGIAYPDLDKSVTTLTMKTNRHFAARFIEKPGLSEMCLMTDLAYVLADIGETETIDTFDRNEIVYDEYAERVYTGNGIPDAAELYALEHVLRTRNLTLARFGGIAHDFAWMAWETNLVQAQEDLPDFAAEIHRVVAGYMTLGDYKSGGFIDDLVRVHYNSEGLTTSAYDRSQQRYLYYNTDADVDGASNLEEWRHASPDGSLDHLETFVDYLFNHKLPPNHFLRAHMLQMGASDSPSRPSNGPVPENDETLAASNSFEGMLPHHRAIPMTPEMLLASMTAFGAPGPGCSTYCESCAQRGILALSPYSQYCTAGLAAWPRGCPGTIPIAPGGSEILPYMSRAVAYVDLEPYTGFSHWSAPGSMLDGARSATAGFQHVAGTTAVPHTIRRSRRIYVDFDVILLGQRVYRIYDVGAHGNAHETMEKGYRAVVGDPFDSAVTLGISWSDPSAQVRWNWSLPSAIPSYSYSDTVTVRVGTDGAGAPFGPEFGAYRPATKTCALSCNHGGRVSGAWKGAAYYLNFFGLPGHEYDGCSYVAEPFPGYTLGVWEDGQRTTGPAYAKEKHHEFVQKQEFVLTLDVTTVAGAPGPGHECPGYIVVEKQRRIGGILYHGPKRYYPGGSWVRLRPVANPGYRFVKWDTDESVKGTIFTSPGILKPVRIQDLEVEEIAVWMRDDIKVTAVFAPIQIELYGVHFAGTRCFPIFKQNWEPWNPVNETCSIAYTFNILEDQYCQYSVIDNRKDPICVAKGATKNELKATLWLSLDNSTSLYVRGVSPGGQVLFESDGPESLFLAEGFAWCSTRALSFKESLPDTIGMQCLSIDWQVRFCEGQDWMDIGSSTNDLFRVFEAGPQMHSAYMLESSPTAKRLLAISLAADGVSTFDEAAAAVARFFDTRTYHPDMTGLLQYVVDARKQGRRETYWHAVDYMADNPGLAGTACIATDCHITALLSVASLQMIGVPFQLTGMLSAYPSSDMDCSDQEVHQVHGVLRFRLITNGYPFPAENSFFVKQDSTWYYHTAYPFTGPYIATSQNHKPQITYEIMDALRNAFPQYVQVWTDGVLGPTLP